MADERYDNEIWDEFRWGEHLDEIERKSEQLRSFIASDSPTNTPRWLMLLKENNNKKEAVDAFIEEELQIEEAYFPEEDDWDEDDDPDYWEDIEDWEDEFFFNDYEETEDYDEGEEWKALSEDFTLTNNGSIETLPVYNQAHELAVYILQWAEELPPRLRNDNCSHFIDKILQIGAKLAGGYSFGFEQDLLGGNIANTKKALFAANHALQILSDDLKASNYLSKLEYQLLHERLFALRNNIGIYVQDLRDLFYRGF